MPFYQREAGIKLYNVSYHKRKTGINKVPHYHREAEIKLYYVPYH